jgi:hypothetical protein
VSFMRDESLPVVIIKDNTYSGAADIADFSLTSGTSCFGAAFDSAVDGSARIEANLQTAEK